MHRRQDAWQRVLLVAVRRATMSLLVGVATVLGSPPDAQAADGCTPVVAHIVSIQGIVELRRPRDAGWKLAEPGVVLCPGDLVRVGRSSRAAVRLANDSTLRLDQRTTVTLEGLDERKSTLLELLTGVFHLITRTPKPFKIKTPFVTAGVEGTEFTVSVDDQGARLAVFEGRVSAANEHGGLMLVSGEAAVAAKGQAPRKELLVRPADAVQWALYYPTIFDYRLGEGMAGTPGEAALRESIALYRQGRLVEAIGRLDNVPEGLGSARFLTYRAGLLLLVGRVDEAGPDIQRALQLDPRDSDAHALQSIVAVVRNDKDQALGLAGKAVEFNEASPSARIALSYAQQAHFKVEEASASVQKAVELDPQNALAWARLAELHMSTGYLDRALEAAQRAVSLNPDLARTQTVLGFANLTWIDTKAAKQAFEKAIALDQADPLPRLGLGLAKIREGDLAAGREEVEIAVSLDPENSLLRSYVGKAYYEEKRDELAGTQFNLAKERDPKDPTPWFYDAILKQGQNRPVEALQDLQKSVELNDNRAVYRSQLLLDEDRASRALSMAKVYDDLDFQQLATVEASRSLMQNPSNYSAHRFLSDTYAQSQRQQITRASELLQAQLLQPINLTPIPPQIAFPDLFLPSSVGIARAGLYEFNPLFEREGVRFRGTGVGGNLGTRGDELALSGMKDRISFSVGQFHFQTDGFRPNNDVRHDIYGGLIQLALSPSANIQAELRTRETKHGDLAMTGAPDQFDPGFRQTVKQDIARLGSRISLAPNSDILLSFIHAKLQDNLVLPDFSFSTFGTDKVDQLEGQYILRASRATLIAGGGGYNLKINIRDFFGGAGPFVISSHGEGRNAYVYSHFPLSSSTLLVLGASYDYVSDAGVKVERVSPKLGLDFRPTPRLSLRLVAFESVKPALIASQTLQPTQILAFSQYFDDLNTTRSKTAGAGLDVRPADSVHLGFQASRRKTEFPGDIFGQPFSVRAEETEGIAYIYKSMGQRASLSIQYIFEEFSRPRDDAIPFGLPFQVRNKILPVKLRYFSPTGWFGSLGTEFVSQRVQDGLTGTTDRNFSLVNAALGYRFPGRRGFLQFEARNIFDKRFEFRDVSFLSVEPLNPRFVPVRTWLARLSVDF
jgi:tetratricopeptide (TPR) repeat protein